MADSSETAAERTTTAGEPATFDSAHRSRALIIGSAALLILLPWYSFRVSQSEWFSLPAKPTGDGMDYENIAFHVWQGEGYTIDTHREDWRAPYEQHTATYAPNLKQPKRLLHTTGRPPLYPTFIATCYAVVGRDANGFRCVRLMNAACLAFAGAMSVGLTYLLLCWFRQVRNWESSTTRLHETGPIALGCGVTLVLAAAQNTMASYANDFLTEPLALCLMQALTVCLVIDGKSPGKKTRVGAGVLLGLLILCRSIFIAWIPGILLLYLIAGPSEHHFSTRLARIGIMVAFAVVICMPWWLRNCMVLETPMPLGTQGAITLLGGYSDLALERGGDWQPEPEQALRASLALPPGKLTLESGTKREVEIADKAKSELRKWIAEHWNDVPELVLARVYTHWNPYTGKSLLWKIATLLGAVIALRYLPRTSVWLIGLPILSTCVVALLYSVGGRFLVPLYGLLFTLSGFGIGCLSLMWVHRSKRPSSQRT